MADRVNVQEFVRDYCRGLKDRDMLSKYDITGRQMIGLVKKLINNGVIAKKDYFERAKRIEELEARQEQDFIESLYHCPVCGHIHPTPFIRCPACESDVSEYRDRDAPSQAPQQRTGVDPVETAEAELEEGAGHESTAEPEPVTEAKLAEEAPPVHRPLRAVPQEAPAEKPEIPSSAAALIGKSLEDTVVEPSRAEPSSMEGYAITDVTAISRTSILLKAEPAEGKGNAIAVKVFHADMDEESEIDRIIMQTLDYQSNMDDKNVVRILGSASLDGKKVLLYEYLPKRLSELLERHPEGLPYEHITPLLAQILNGMGYSHTHRGRDQIVRRLPHLSLSPANLLLNEEEDTIKIDDCGLNRAAIDVRGFMKYLWQEPGVDAGALGPEGFVVDGKFVNLLIADIYSLGVVMYRMVTGQRPFSGPGFDEYRFQQLKTYPIPPRVHRFDVPAWLDEMILRCLEKEPDKRWRSPTEMELSIGKTIDRHGQ